MKKILPFISFLVVIVLNSNCSYDVFHKKSKNKRITNRYYDKGDTLFIRNYALYNTREEMLLFFNNKPFDINLDSIIKHIVLSSFDKLEIANLNVNICENIIDSTLYNKPSIRLRHISNEYLNDLAKNNEDELILVPIVYAYNQFTFTGFISSGGLSGSNGWNTMTWLSILIYIIKDSKIVYSRQIRYKSERVWANSKKEILKVPPLAAVKQEHWDELVRLAMEDYMNRLK